MLHIRRRWPILTALIAAVAYTLNNYQITGLEHLRVQPRPGAANHPSWGEFEAAAVGTSGSAGLTSGLTDWNLESATWPTTAPTPSTSIPPWREQLSLGEKFTLWQEQQQSNGRASGGSSISAQPSMPVSVPIPLPPGMTGLAVPPPGLLSGQGLPTTAAPTASTPRPAAPSAAAPLTAPGTTAFSTATLPVASPGNLASTLPNNKLHPKDSPRLAAASQRIKIASFNAQSLGAEKLANPAIMELLVNLLKQFDIVALQEVHSPRDDILPNLIDRLNQSGRHYDYLIGPRVGRATNRDQFAFVFDTSRVETDRFQLYTVEDPDDLVSYDPLVAWFRCKGVPTQQAFTFSLVNVRIDPDAAHAELGLLPNLIEAVTRDGRGEDDWILAGDFGVAASQLTMLDRSQVRFAVQETPTDVVGEQMRDLILFSSRGTTEFTGRGGVFDFLRKFNLSLERALEVSDHLPVWAEFSTVEGAEPGRLAPQDPQAVY